MAAKARHRIERATAEPQPEQPFTPAKLSRLDYVTITLRHKRQTLLFRVHRWNAKRFLVRGRFQAASRIGRIVAVALEGLL